MAYADFTFYVEQYKGASIDAADFNRLAMRASAFIDRVTFGRAAPVMETEGETGESEYVRPVKLATCAVAEEMERGEQGGQVQSERVGQHSVTYVSGSSLTGEQSQAKAARLYLAVTGLMYRGLDAD